MRLRTLVLACVLVGAASLALMRAPISQAAPAPPLFEKGGVYDVVVDCIPTWIARWISATQAGGAPLNPCFVEQITVVEVRSDGWLQTKDDNGTEWIINPARIYAVAKKPSASPTPTRAPAGIRVETVLASQRSSIVFRDPESVYLMGGRIAVEPGRCQFTIGQGTGEWTVTGPEDAEPCLYLPQKDRESGRLVLWVP